MILTLLLILADAAPEAGSLNTLLGMVGGGSMAGLVALLMSGKLNHPREVKVRDDRITELNEILKQQKLDHIGQAAELKLEITKWQDIAMRSVTNNERLQTSMERSIGVAESAAKPTPHGGGT